MAAGKKLIMNVQGKGEKKKMASKKGLNASKMHIFYFYYSRRYFYAGEKWISKVRGGGGWTGRNAQRIIIPYNGILVIFMIK